LPRLPGRGPTVGSDDNFVSYDGFLILTKKNQRPPDLRYFKPALR
jgi:hypothetical protein